VFDLQFHPVGGASSSPTFAAAAPFDELEASLHINEQEMIAVLKGIRAVIFARGDDAVRGRHFDFWLDNKVAGCGQLLERWR
jgi:hypothetical protein